MFSSKIDAIVFIMLLSKVSTFQNVYYNRKMSYVAHLGTKSGYRFHANWNDTEVVIPGCKPLKIWMIIRHGTRYPGTKKILNMRDSLGKIREEILRDSGDLCYEDLELFEQWEMHTHPDDDKNLADEGRNEMMNLAERMQHRFPTLFPKEYYNSTYDFRFTKTQRCEESARYFTIGLFGSVVARNVWFPEALHRDPILRFYKLCEKWRVTIKKNQETYKERFKFEKTKLMYEVRKQVTERLGLDKVISIDNLKLLYSTCGFETAWNLGKESPWCLALAPESFQALEYNEDIKYYWVDGPGFELTRKQACPIIQDIVKFFNNTFDPHTSKVYFSHSGTILKVLSLLGLYTDSEPLRHDNYHDMMDRQWRVSKIDCFASNIAFVLYDCNNEKSILALHQERPVQIPGCPENSILCPYRIFKEVFKDSLYNCRFDEMCRLDEKSTKNSWSMPDSEPKDEL